MKIESLWIKGFRSLREVSLKDLGAFNVFYGQNGAGKSNILEAIRMLLRLAASAAQADYRPFFPEEGVTRARAAIDAGIVKRRDLCAYDRPQALVIGARFTEKPSTYLAELEDLSLEITLDWLIEQEPKLWISMLSSGGRDLRTLFEPAEIESKDELGERIVTRDRIRATVLQELPRAYGLVGAHRALQAEKYVDPPANEDVVSWHLRSGRLKNALLVAQVSPNQVVRRRLAAFRTLLSGEPLHRPPFDPVQDPLTNAIDLREPLPEPNPEGRDISLDLVGLGIAQIYAILAQAMLLGGSVIGIEEPEAHLHAPTSGRHLRQLLVRLVEEKYISQLFIATHSNLFDLDPTGYFDVSLEGGCTVVKRAELTRIDREHLYEPGPAKHALQRMLEYTPADEVVFRRSDGSPVTAKEMLRLLQEDDAVAVSFLQDIHGAAVRAVKVKAKRSEGG
jgi:hypothetical protein